MTNFDFTEAAEHTDCNDHNGARIIIAEDTGAVELAKKFELIQEAHIKAGELSYELNVQRRALELELMEFIETTHGKEVRDAAHNAL